MFDSLIVQLTFIEALQVQLTLHSEPRWYVLVPHTLNGNLEANLGIYKPLSQLLGIFLMR